MIRRLYAVLLIAAAASCSKTPSSDATPPASSAASGGPSASAARAAAPPSSASPTGAAAAAGGGSFSGTYTAKVGAVAPPENAKEKTWIGDPGTAAVGPGTIDFSISGTRGETQGETKGPLGEMTISGVFDGKELRANLTPKDPKAENAMTGFMALVAAEPAATSLKGTLRVSNRDARLVREASVEVSRR